MPLSRCVVHVLLTAILAACASAPRGAGPTTGSAASADTSATQAGSTVAERRARCAPVHESLLALGPVHAECDVDARARLRGQPARVNFSPGRAAAMRGSCYEARFELVVDERGMPDSRLVRVVRGNNTEFTEAARASVLADRYTPALKDGAPVRSVVKAERMIMTVVVRSNGPPPMATRPSGC
ncbi:MAG TPA: hypothetical protein VEA99_11010 [Gemmatimonadaceae bacterium]|nr:hypothetical protein [Gemmatimonadaceae bacterium]